MSVPRGSRVINIGRESPVKKSEEKTEKPQPFIDMQKNMESELERRRKDWESEVEKMQEDFFKVKVTDEPETQKNKVEVLSVDSPRRTQVGKDIVDVGNSKNIYTEDADGSKKFRVRFDVRGYEADEVSVQAEGFKITVTAKREEISPSGNKSTRQFNRQVDIPTNVDADKLLSYMSGEGILTVEAPVEERHFPQPQIHREILHQPPSTGFAMTVAPPRYHSVVHSVAPTSSPRMDFRSNEQSIVDTEHGKKLKMVVDVGQDYDPADISVKLIGRKVAVQAKREEVVAGRKRRSEYSREFDIAEFIEPRTLRAMLAGNGKLHVGGSIRHNRDHDAVLESVLIDMPSDGKSCKTDTT